MATDGKRTLLAGVGAAFGAFTQDPIDNPLAGIAGAAVGGGVGYMVAQDAMDTYSRLRPQQLTMDSISRRRIDVSAATDTSMEVLRRDITFQMERMIGKPENFETYRNNLQAIYKDKFQDVGDFDQLLGSMESHLDTIHSDKKAMQEFKDILANDRNIYEFNAGPVNNASGRSMSIGSGDDLKEIRSKLRGYGINELGMNRKTSAEFSNLMSPALLGRNATLKEHELTLHTLTEGNLNMSLTAYDGDMTYTKKNGVYQIARGVNPLGKSLLGDEEIQMKRMDGGGIKSVKVQTIADKNSLGVTTRYTPDALFGLTHAANIGGDLTDKEIKDVFNIVNKEYIFSGADSTGKGLAGREDLGYTGFAQRQSQSINLEYSLEQYLDKDTNTMRAKLSKINTRIPVGGTSSESNMLFGMIQQDTGINPKVNQGSSSLTMMTSVSAVDNLYNPGMLPAEKRAASSVNYRAQTHVYDSKLQWLDRVEAMATTDAEIDSINELRRSAQHGTRIQVSDEMADLIPHMFGKDQKRKGKKTKLGRGDLYSIDDGHGIFNMSQKRRFAMQEETSMTIANVGDKLNSKYMMSLGIPEDIMNKGDFGIMDYLDNNTVTIKPGEIVGYNREGRAETLPRHFSSGVVNAIHRTDEGLRLSITGTWKPEDWVKIFGVSAKSGLTGATTKDFQEMGAFALAESRGLIQMTKDAKGNTGFKLGPGIQNMQKFIKETNMRKQGAKIASNVVYTPQQMLGIFRENNRKGVRNTISRLFDEARESTMMQRWSDVGQGDVSKILYGSKDEATASLKGIVESLKGKGVDNVLSRLEGGDLSTADRARKASTYRALLAISSEKSNQDMFLSLAEHVSQSTRAAENRIRSANKSRDKLMGGIDAKGFTSNKEQKRLQAIEDTIANANRLISQHVGGSGREGNLEFLRRLEKQAQAGGYDEAGNRRETKVVTEGEVNRIRRLMHAAFKDKEGTSVTQFTSSLGESNLGSGSKGALSWMETSMFRSTGFDSAILDSLANHNRGALQELAMIHSVYHEGTFDSKSFKQGIDKARGMKEIFKTGAPARRQALMDMGVKVGENSTIASYTLKNAIGKTKSGAEQIISVPISLEDTMHSGLKDYAGREMLFEIEKIRNRLVESDINMSSAMSVAAKASAAQKHQDIGDELLAMQNRMIHGENNIRKVAARMEAKSSILLTARPISGMHDTAEMVAYISKNTAKKLYKEQGLNYADHISKGKNGLINLSNGYGQALYGQLSREPAQGPGSSIGYRLMVSDKVDPNSEHIYVPKSNTLLNKFAFLDYDADHLRMMTTLPLSEKQTSQFTKRNQMMISGLTNLEDMQSNLGVKGTATGMDVITQFKDNMELEKYKLDSASVSNIRKIDSPEISKLVLEMNKALDMEGKGDKLYLAERVLAHNLTENLLKSQHKGLGEGLSGAIQEVALLHNKHASDLSDSDLRKGLEKIIVGTLGGKRESMSKQSQGIFDNAAKELARVASKHHKTIQDAGETFLGTKASKFSLADAQQSLIEYAGMQSGEGPIPSRVDGVDMKSIMHSGKKLYNEVGSEIMGFLDKNKAPLGAGLVGLGTLALMSRDTPEQLAASSPSTPPEPLQPLPDKKGYIRKYNPGSDRSISGIVNSNGNYNSGSLDRALFGDDVGKVSINITDKSGMF